MRVQIITISSDEILWQTSQVLLLGWSIHYTFSMYDMLAYLHDAENNVNILLMYTFCEKE